jgi:hypothetical protein
MKFRGRAARGRARRKRGVVCALSVAGMWLAAGDLGTAQDASPAGAQGGPGTHAVVEGDTLWDLSRQYYGSSYEWPRMWSLNPEITNPHWIYPGHMLRVEQGAQGGFTAAPQGAQAGTARRAPLMRGASARLPAGTVQLGEEVYLDTKALSGAGTIVGSSEDHMMLSPTDEVYLKFEKGDAPQLGQELSVFVRLHRAEVNHEAGKLRTYRANDGEVVRVLGALKVKSYDDDTRTARAEITEAIDPIERGFEVTDVPRQLAQVTPRTNRVSVQSEIVAAPRPLGTLGQNQVVFLGVGAEKGVEIGNRFSVLRQGDAWRDDLSSSEDLMGAQRPARRGPAPKEFPVEVVGEARVIYVRPDSCTALITSSVTELVPGDRVEMREGY